MDRMKTFFKYFVVFLIVYFLVDIGSLQVMKSAYLTKEFSANSDLPAIEITESKATITNGYVRGKIENNTDSDLVDRYLKLDFFTPRNINMGTKFVDIGTLKPGEEKEFESKFNFDNIDHITGEILTKEQLAQWQADEKAKYDKTLLGKLESWIGGLKGDSDSKGIKGIFSELYSKIKNKKVGELDFTVDDIAKNKTALRTVLWAVFIFFGKEIAVAFPLL